tara:strand:- start:2311 stop:3336 length:1026 start_codon:yes stop_codon:yes gene_type:complete
MNKYTRIKTKADFISRSNQIHNNYYDYSLVNFPVREPIKVRVGLRGGETKETFRKPTEYYREAIVDIECPKHGVFSQRARKHLEGHGCQKCANEKTAAVLSGRESTIEHKKEFYNGSLSLSDEVRQRIIQNINDRQEAKNQCIVKKFYIEYKGSKYEIFIDEEDYGLVSQYNWSLSKTGRKKRDGVGEIFYVNTKIPRPDKPRYVYTFPNGKQRTYVAKDTLSIHRLIMNPEKGQVVDHINGNTLDNRKHNLRCCSYQGNSANSIGRHKTKSKYKGVSPCRGKTNPWAAMIRKDGKTVNLGSYNTEEDAAMAYDIAAIEIHGEFSYTNFPIEKYLYPENEE